MLAYVPWATSFWNTVCRFADCPAVSDGQQTVNHADLARRVAGLAAALAAGDSKAGDPVGTLLPNSVDAVAASYAVLISGRCEVPINAAAGPAEWKRSIELSRPRTVICRRADAHFVRDLVREVICPEDTAAKPFDPSLYPPVPAHAWARVVFTSGSTGIPKVIVHSQAGRWTGAVLQRLALPFKPGPGDRLLAMTPFAHGASLLTHAFLDSGAAAELLPGVELERVIPRLQSGEISAMFAPPTALAKIVAGMNGRATSGLKTIFTGTAPLLPSAYFDARKVFGPIIRITYGKSEVFNPITVMDPAETDAYYESGGGAATTCIGWPEAGVEIRVVDDRGRPVPSGETGEIMVRAQHMSLGMLRDGVLETWPDMWHPTGDVGMVDERGRVHIVGRLADAIKTGGYKIFPAEIEQVISAVAGLPDIVVVGMPSAYWGEIVVAVAQTTSLSWRGQATAACERLPKYKRPRLFAEMAELPRNAQHKVVRSRIVSALKEQYTLEDGPYPSLRKPDAGEQTG